MSTLLSALSLPVDPARILGIVNGPQGHYSWVTASKGEKSHTHSTYHGTTPQVVGESLEPISKAEPIHIAVVGVGFVGESLLKEFGTAFRATGFDISAKRIAALGPVFADHSTTLLSSNELDLAGATHYLVSVPTLLNADHTVNLSYVEAAVSTVLRYARPGACIVLESSVTVGTTRRLLGPYAGHLHCGMSPERVDPGRTQPPMHTIPKIVSGLDSDALAAITAIYSKVFTHVVPVSKPEVAEFTKLFENCYRMVNIAYVNEMADACRTHGIEPKEMIDAAATKPYGFSAFTPGLGVGGHCIPVNPFYLFANNKNLPVLERATKQMLSRPWKLAKKFHRRCLLASAADVTAASRGLVSLRTSADLAGAAFAANGFASASLLPRILIVGVAFKSGQSVISCSPGLDFARSLQAVGCARLAFFDPLVGQDQVGGWLEKLGDECWTAMYLAAEFDGIAVCMRQSGVEFNILERLTGSGGPLVRWYV